MKKLFVGIVLSILGLALSQSLFTAVDVQAQNVTCSDRPSNDSSNACADTRFVQGKIASAGTVTSIAAGTGITLTPSPITGAGTISLTVPVVPANGGTGTSTVFTTGSIPFAGAGGVYTQNNSKLFFDNTNFMLGVGTNTPFADNNNVPGAVVRSDNNSFTRFGLINRSSGSAAVADLNVSLGSGTGANYSNRLAIVGGNPVAISAVDTAVVSMVYGAPLYQWEDTTLATQWMQLNSTALTVNNTTASTSKTTGALISGGGLGVALSANIGTILNVGYTPALQANMQAGFQGAGTGVTFIGQDPAATNISGLWMGVSGLVPSGVNYTFLSDGTNAYLNATGGAGTVHLQVGTADIGLVTSTGLSVAGNIQSKGTVPVGTTGSCVASSFVGGATAGKFSAAVCAAGTIILSSLPAATNGYTCNAQDQTTPADTLKQTANTTTSVTFTSTTVAADVIVYSCIGW